MSNRYLTLDGTKKISETYQQIPAGFDLVQEEMDANKDTVDEHIADAEIHVTTEDKTNWNSKAPGSTQTDLVAHTGNADIHVTAAKKAEWDSKADGITATELAEHVADMVAHLTSEEHTKLTGIAAGAEVNQNAFATIGTITASTPTDSVTFEAGTGIVITYNAATKKITFTANGEAIPGAHGSSHDSDGADPIPDLVALQATVADQAIDIATAQAAAEAAQTTANAAETPAGAQAKADSAENVAILTAATDATNKANAAMMQTGLYGEATNSGNDYSITVSEAVTALVVGLPIRFKVTADSVGAPVLNVNGLGAQSVLKANGSAASFKTGGIYTVVYDGTNFILQGEGGGGTAGAGDIRAGETATVDAGDVTGTLVTRDSGGAVTVTPTTEAQTLQAGIYDNSITVQGYTPGKKFFQIIIAGDNANHNIDFGFTASSVVITNTFGTSSIAYKKYDGTYSRTSSGSYMQLLDYPSVFTGSGLSNLSLQTAGGTYKIQAWE